MKTNCSTVSPQQWRHCSNKARWWKCGLEVGVQELDHLCVIIPVVHELQLGKDILRFGSHPVEERRDLDRFILDASAPRPGSRENSCFQAGHASSKEKSKWKGGESFAMWGANREIRKLHISQNAIHVSTQVENNGVKLEQCCFDHEVKLEYTTLKSDQ